MLFFFQNYSFSQDQHLVDSLEAALKNHNAKKIEMHIVSPSLYDTAAVNIYHSLSTAYYYSNYDKAMDYTKQWLALSEQIGFKKGIFSAYIRMGGLYNNKGEYSTALEIYNRAFKMKDQIDDKKTIGYLYMANGYLLLDMGNYSESLNSLYNALKILEKIGDKIGTEDSYNGIGLVYKELGNFDEALKNYFASLSIIKEEKDTNSMAALYHNIGEIYDEQGSEEKALDMFLKAKEINIKLNNAQWLWNNYVGIGTIYYKQSKYDEALINFISALNLTSKLEDKEGMMASIINIGKINLQQKKYDQASQNLNKGLTLSKKAGNLKWIKESYEGLATLDSIQHNVNKALEDYKLYVIYRDSLVNTENTKKTVALQMNYAFDKKQVADSLKFAQEKEIGAIKLQKQKAITYGSFAGIAITIMLLFFVYRNYDKQRIANQKLKEAQEQLIKSEKMAAFGVMASRVSHEIQNPLNFVNNFSELAEEMVNDIVKSDNEQERKETAKDLLNNLQKIKHHGKRADTIVKLLQEHTKKGTAHEYFEAKQE